jgi:hypothetical protein
MHIRGFTVGHLLKGSLLHGNRSDIVGAIVRAYPWGEDMEIAAAGGSRREHRLGAPTRLSRRASVAGGVFDVGLQQQGGRQSVADLAIRSSIGM